VLTFVMEASFFALFGGALVSFLRMRRQLQLDVLLVFTTIAALFGLQLLAAAGIKLPTELRGVGVVALLAHAPFSLRLASDLAPVPRWARTTAWGAFVLLALALQIPAAAPIAVIPAIGYFVVVDAGAAVAMASRALRSGGSAQVRLWSAGAATAFMALALLALGSTVISKELGAIANVVVYGAALGAAATYLAAFLPPLPCAASGNPAAP
jgi:hypothetical protein